MKRLYSIDGYEIYENKGVLYVPFSLLSADKSSIERISDILSEEEKKNLTKAEVDAALSHMIEAYQKLPQGAKLAPVSHSDLESVLWLLLGMLRAD